MNKITIKFDTELKPTKHIVINYNFTTLTQKKTKKQKLSEKGSGEESKKKRTKL